MTVKEPLQPWEYAKTISEIFGDELPRWKQIEFTEFKRILFFVKDWEPNNNCTFFEFKTLNSMGASYLKGEAIREEYEIFIHGVVTFDGLRHLYFGSSNFDNDGYFYYPNYNEIIAVFKKLHELIKVTGCECSQ